MNCAHAVRVAERGRDGQEMGQRDLELHALDGSELRPQVPAVEVLHHEPDEVVLATEIEHLEDVVVVHAGPDAALAEEPRRELVVAHEVLVQELHGHALAEHHVAPLEDGGGPALADQPEQLVGAEA